MKIIRGHQFVEQLINILRYIARDKHSAAIKFEKELNKKIKNLVDFPYRCRSSLYFNDEAYRDMIHYGYTIIYKVEQDRILILEIFKWQDR